MDNWMLSDFKKQQPSIRIGLFLLIIIAVLLIILASWERADIHSMFKDIYVMGENVPPLPLNQGFLSNIGIVLWGFIVAINGFTVFVGYRLGWRGNIIRFWVLSTDMALYLLIDDGILMHDRFFPTWGIPEKVTLFAVMFGFLVYLSLVYPIIFETTDYFLLGLALLLLGCSFFVDMTSDLNLLQYSISSDIYLLTNFKDLLEDGTKFMGIFTLVLYFGATSAKHITSSVKGGI